jgi:DNA-binding NarL/FixJ family response regulator
MSNNKILVLEDASSSISVAYDCSKLEYNNQSKDDEIHQWLLTNRALFDKAEKIIIPARLGKDDSGFIGIYIGLHIRLTMEFGKSRYLPIAFVSESSKEDILTNQLENNSDIIGLLLFTRGIFLMSSFDLANNFIKKHILPSDETIFREEAKSKLVFKLPDRGHYLANKWGAFRLAKYAGLDLKVQKPTSLFFKYKEFLSNNEKIETKGAKSFLVEKPCLALLIDDQADAGWAECLDYILKVNVQGAGKARKLTTIKNFEDANNLNDYTKYDVIFLDLRLLPGEDRNNQIPDVEAFSGTKILKKIKEQNRGTQVIIFTASNKAWNIQKLIDFGADGYYIKESPEYVLSSKFSTDNFNAMIFAIRKCLSRSYMRDVFTIHKECSEFIHLNKKKKTTEYQAFYNRTLVSLDIAFEMLNKSADNQKYFNFAFLSYYHILEDYISQRENFVFVSNKECYVSSGARVIEEIPGQIKWTIEFHSDPNGSYFTNNQSFILSERAVGTLAKVSFVLVNNFSGDNADLKRWARINFIRNTKAGHGGDSQYVTVSEITDLLKLLKIVLTI